MPTHTVVNFGAPESHTVPHALATPTDVLVVGSGLGTGVGDTWGASAAELTQRYQVLGVELPGHGGAPGQDAPLRMEGLAAQVADTVTRLRAEGTIAAGARVFFAGVSISGALALQLALDYPELFAGIAVICSAPKIGEAAAWRERAEFVRASGTPALLVDSVQRWFAPGFVDAHPEQVGELLRTFHEVDRFSYARLCEVLAQFDVRDCLPRIGIPVLSIQGAQDPVCSPEDGALIAETVPGGAARDAHVLAAAAHQAPIEQPREVAQLLTEFIESVVETDSAERDAAVGTDLAEPRSDPTRSQVRAAGTEVRSQVLGAQHVRRAQQNADSFTGDFQTLITEYAWGSIWTRPGLDRRMRSAVTLSALVQGGYWEEFAMHVGAALRNGLSRAEIKEILLQCAIYCSVPAANTAFKIAQEVLANADDVDADADVADRSAGAATDADDAHEPGRRAGQAPTDSTPSAPRNAP